MRQLFAIGAAAILTSLALVPRARAQVSAGEADYRDHCAVCHGPTGAGDGQAVMVLTGMQPGDLSLLAKNNGGSFPTARVFAAVTGRDSIPAHHLGPGGMPLWEGDMRRAGGPSLTSPAAAQARAWDLVRYVQSLQR
ncbi:MAG TPA: c-type cytochrome [Candidatus Binataceae bacterium]|nr:c-type cytochrome [Candidatus Binataceae bacterium]